MEKEKKIIRVVAAIIRRQGKILCTRRGPGGPAAYKWEFPGGKIEAGESPRQALVREIKEELGVRLTIENFFMRIEHTYPGSQGFHLVMDNYLCTIEEDHQLLAHQEDCWLLPQDLASLDWAEADRPLIERLIRQKDLVTEKR